MEVTHKTDLNEKRSERMDQVLTTNSSKNSFIFFSLEIKLFALINSDVVTFQKSFLDNYKTSVKFILNLKYKPETKT